MKTMRKYMLSTAMVAGLLAWAALPSAASARTLATFDVDHPFTVVKTQLAAGSYDIIEDDALSNTLILRNTKTGKDGIFAYETRLASRPNGQAEVVFDKVGNTEYLSEIHLDYQDGYLFPFAKEKHTHTRVKVTMKKK
jgi:hypothetical protein